MKLLTTVSNGPQAEIICALLEEAGISASARGDSSVALAGEAAPHDIYVEDADLERAKDTLNAFQRESEDELAGGEDEQDGAAQDTPPPAG
jgi:hypothetical protein